MSNLVTTFRKCVRIFNYLNHNQIFQPKFITYLGTLDLNQPEYSIMAQRVIESNKIVFAIKNNTENKIVIKTANQIINEQSVISRMSPTDAVKIGYALGSNDFN